MNEREPGIRELLDQIEEVPPNRWLAAVGYIPLLFFLPLFTHKDDSFARFHGKQSLILVAGLIGIWILIWILDLLLGGLLSHIFIIGVIFKVMAWVIHYLVGGVVSIAYFVAIVYGAIHALAGRKHPIPVIGVFARQLPL